MQLAQFTGLGLVVVKLESGGPAEKAGVLLGDILTALDVRVQRRHCPGPVELRMV